MRTRVLIGVGSLAIACGALGATAAASSTVNHYTGGAGPSDSYHMSFNVVLHDVEHFTFQSRCAGNAHGVTVAVKIPIRKGRFSLHNSDFTVTGQLLPGGLAKGTERHRTGDCDSGTLHWSARK